MEEEQGSPVQEAQEEGEEELAVLLRKMRWLMMVRSRMRCWLVKGGLCMSLCIVPQRGGRRWWIWTRTRRRWRMRLWLILWIATVCHCSRRWSCCLGACARASISLGSARAMVGNPRLTRAPRQSIKRFRIGHFPSSSKCCLTLAAALWSSAWPQAVSNTISVRILFWILLRESC